MQSPVFKGTVHGKTIELEEAPGLPDGQAVTVLVQPVPAQEALPPGDGLRRSFGAWSEDAEELAKFLEWNRQQRQRDRREIAE
ncbi:hypothetical protein AYO44_18260 [Planctomycetaceae bacterium SCGC AG-212-F19]|nr:hypothetical protein AYO44_18260 [Planctomycetaceae bacterium SCGC AG-212-F19]